MRGKKIKPPLSAKERRNAVQLARDLDLGLRWALTPQGLTYWKGVHKKLLALGESPVCKCCGRELPDESAEPLP